MNKLIKLGVATFLVFGGGLVNAVESTSAKTNERVLETTVDALSISNVIRPVIRGGSTIAIRNIEADKTTDRKIVALIEDQMVIDLLSKGYAILERDDNAIRRVIEEGGRANYSIIRGEMEYLDQLRYRDATDKNNVVVEPTAVEDNRKHLLLTHLKSADYVLSYRVQELGINYVPLDLKNMTRHSIARLHIRVEEVSTGKILLAENVESTAKDTISNNQVKALAFNPRSQFYQAYPGQNPDEGKLYVLSDKHVYVQMALLNTFTDQTSGFSIKSPIQIGLMYGDNGDQRIAYETLTGETEKKIGDVKIPMQQEASLLVYGRTVAKFAVGSIVTSVVPEVGLGNGALTNWDSIKGPVEEKGVAIKLGVGLETQILPKVDIRLSADYYKVKSNSLALGAMSVRYRF